MEQKMEKGIYIFVACLFALSAVYALVYRIPLMLAAMTCALIGPLIALGRIRRAGV